MESTNNSLFSIKNILIFLVLLIMIIAIPVAVYLSNQQTQLKSRAAGDGNMTFTGEGVKESGGQYSTTTKDIQVVVTSPFGK